MFTCGGVSLYVCLDQTAGCKLFIVYHFFYMFMSLSSKKGLVNN